MDCAKSRSDDCGSSSRQQLSRLGIDLPLSLRLLYWGCPVRVSKRTPDGRHAQQNCEGVCPARDILRGKSHRQR